MEDTASRSTQAGQKESETTSERLLTIGQVVAQLQTEFPDLSISKIRYLEDRKLISPARTKGRYRKYSSADIRRLRTILSLQRDEYLPLEVIRQRVERASSPTPGQSLASAVAPLRSTQVLRREEPVYSWMMSAGNWERTTASCGYSWSTGWWSRPRRRALSSRRATWRSPAYASS